MNFHGKGTTDGIIFEKIKSGSKNNADPIIATVMDKKVEIAQAWKGNRIVQKFCMNWLLSTVQVQTFAKHTLCRLKSQLLSNSYCILWSILQRLQYLTLVDF